MKRKIIAAILCGIMALSLTACNKTDEQPSVPVSSTGTGENLPDTKLPEKPEVTLNSTIKPLSELDVYSEGVYMVNLETDTVVASKNADKKLYPASTAKIMTCLVTLENVKDLTAKVECPYDCFDEFYGDDPNFYDAASAGIEPLQDNLTYTDCLYGLMVASGCDAGNVIAYNVGGGDIEKFVNMMNDTAKKIGCTGTNFTNPHGLFEEDNVTTAHDLYLITRYAMDKHPDFMKICSTYEYEMPANETFPEGYTLVQSNALMREDSDFYRKDAKGIKTGSIYAYYLMKDGEWDLDNEILGFTSLVSSAEKGGLSYLLVTLQSPYSNEEDEHGMHFADHNKLYDLAFGEYELAKLVEKGKAFAQIDVLGGETETVEITAAESYNTIIPKSLEISSIERKIVVPEALAAPVKKGQLAGYMELTLSGKTFAVIELTAANDVAVI